MHNIVLLLVLSVLTTCVYCCNETNYEVNYFCLNCRRTCQSEPKKDDDAPIMGCGCKDGFIMDERTNECLALNLAPAECNVTAIDYNYGFIYFEYNVTEPTTEGPLSTATPASTFEATTEATGGTVEAQSTDKITEIVTSVTSVTDNNTEIDVTTEVATILTEVTTILEVGEEITEGDNEEDSPTTEFHDFQSTVSTFKPEELNSTEDSGVIWKTDKTTTETIETTTYENAEDDDEGTEDDTEDEDEEADEEDEEESTDENDETTITTQSASKNTETSETTIAGVTTNKSITETQATEGNVTVTTKTTKSSKVSN